MQCRLNSKREQNDAHDQQQMEIRVRVPGELRPVDAGCFCEALFGEDCSNVEVEPPERRDEDDAECSSSKHLEARVAASTDADRDHRFAERNQNDQPVAFSKV